MAIPKIIAKFETTLSTGISDADTSMTLSSITTGNGTAMPAGTYGFVLSEGKAEEEYILADCDGSSSTLTNLSRGLSYLDGVTEVEALSNAHRKGAVVKITDHPILVLMYDRSLVWQGTYVAETTYAVKDAVSYNGSSFIANTETTGNLPTDTDYWDVLAKQGTDGIGSVDPGTYGNVLTSNGVTWEAMASTDASIVRAEKASGNVTAAKTIMNFTVVQGDTLSEYDNSTYRFTPINTGWYKVSVSASISSSAYYYTDVYAMVDGANYSAQRSVNEGDQGGPGGIFFEDMIYMETGSYLEIWWDNYSTATPIVAYGDFSPRLNINSVTPTPGAKGDTGEPGEAGSGGDVVGPASPAGSGNSFAIFDGETGKLLKYDNTINISSAGVMNIPTILMSGHLYAIGNINTNGDIRNYSGSSFIGFTNVDSSVNYIGIKNNITGNAPELQATGTDTNIDLKLAPKGTGDIVVDGNIDLNGNGLTGLTSNKPITGESGESGGIVMKLGDSIGDTTFKIENSDSDTIMSFQSSTTDTIGFQRELDMNNNSIGFTMQTATGDGTTTIDWKNGNHMDFTFGATNETFTFTAPSSSGVYTISLKQDSVGSRTATWPATVKWAGGVAPTLTTTASTGYDLITFRYDGSNFYGVPTLDFS